MHLWWGGGSMKNLRLMCDQFLCAIYMAVEREIVFWVCLGYEEVCVWGMRRFMYCLVLFKSYFKHSPVWMHCHFFEDPLVNLQ